MRLLPMGNTATEAFQNGKINKNKKETKTYKIRHSENRIYGEIEGLEALIQSVEKELSTEKYLYPIYPWNYGVKTSDLLGVDSDLAALRLKRRIEKCLLKDERIESVENFKLISINSDEMAISFEVKTIYGNFKTRKAVEI